MNQSQSRIKIFLGHFAFWGFYFIITELDIYNNASAYINLQLNLYFSLVHIILSIILVYANTFWLMPQFLYKKKVTLYIVLLVMVCLGFAFLDMYGHQAIVPQELVEIFREEGMILEPHNVTVWATFKVFSNVLTSVVGISSVWLILDSFKTKAQLEKIEKNHLETQLNLLKAQINPHFLFNVLNSVHFLIPNRPGTASEVLGKLSEMLQYQLYRAKEGKVSLQDELNQIKRYIELEALRREDTLSLNTNLDDIDENPLIEPFMLLPLVENAFKHSRSIGKDYINIDCQLINNRLILDIQNSVPIEQPKTQGGIGIQNLTKRLELLYPGAYEYKHELKNGMYKAQLILNL